MFCSNCGEKIPESGAFCVNCGQKVNMDAYTAPMQEPPVPQPVQGDLEPPSEPVQYDAAAEQTAAASVPEPVVTQTAVAEPPASFAAPVQEPSAARTAESSDSLTTSVPEPAAARTAVAEPPAPFAAPAQSPQPEPVSFAAPEPAVAPVLPAAPVLKPVKEPVRGAKKALLVALSVFLCLLAFAFLTAGAAVLSVRLATTRQDLDDMLGKLNLSEVKANALLSNVADKDMTLTEYIYESIPESNRRDYRISEDAIVEILESPSVRAFVSEKLAGYFDDLYYDTRNTKLTAREIVALVVKNADIIEEATGYEMTDEDYNKIEEDLTSNQDFNSLTLTKLEESAGFSFTPLRWGLSYISAALLFVLAVFMLFLLLLTWRKRLRPFLMGAGYTLLVSGLFYISAGLFAHILTGLFLPVGERLLSTLISPLMKTFLIAGLSALGVSVVMLIVFYVLRGIARKKSQAVSAA